MFVVGWMWWMGGRGPFLSVYDVYAQHETPQQDAAAQWQLAVMAVCNNSTLNPRAAGDAQPWTGIGDQTEVALKVLAAECGLPWPDARLKRTGEIAFDSDRKCMSVVCKAVAPVVGEQGTSKTGEAGSFAAGPADLNKRWVVVVMVIDD